MGAPVDPASLERLSPGRLLSFSFPSPSDPPYYTGDCLRVAVLDSALPNTTPAHPRIAAMLVPRSRESDWVFSTESGLLQLLLFASSFSPDLPISRLILVGDLSDPGAPPRPYALPDPGDDPESLERFQQSLLPLLLALAPRESFNNGIPEVPFLSYEDGVVRSAPVEVLAGPVVGEMLVEDVEIDGPPSPELRRRLRFKRMPNLVQTQVRLVPDSENAGSFRPDLGSLVQPYLAAMVAGLALIAPSLEDERDRLGSRPRALCIGVGGGALLMFLQSYIGFDVLGIEADGMVLGVAKRHFGLVEGEFLKVTVGDGIEFIERLAREVEFRQRWDGHCGESGDGSLEVERDIFDAIMVDVDAGDAKNGISAPPLEFLQKTVLMAARLALKKHGILVVNVIPPDGSFYKWLTDAFHEVFSELYELDVGNGENYVLMATNLPIGSAKGEKWGAWVKKLKQVIDHRLVDSIKRI